MRREERRKLDTIGRDTFACIREMVERLEASDDSQGLEADREHEAAREAIEQDPLSIEVREDWHAANDGPGEAAEYRILLSTGGPAVRIVGELSQGEPISARLEVQDWGTPWTDVTRSDWEETLLTYARVFYWGDS